MRCEQGCVWELQHGHVDGTLSILPLQHKLRQLPILLLEVPLFMRQHNDSIKCTYPYSLKQQLRADTGMTLASAATAPRMTSSYLFAELMLLKGRHPGHDTFLGCMLISKGRNPHQ